MQIVVGVKFKSNSKTYYFDPNGQKYSVGEKVIVDTASGNSLGEIEFEDRQINEKDLEEPLRSVVRKATDRDIARNEEMRKKGKEVLGIIEEKVSNLKLIMKIVGAEYSFDGNKIIIEFTADGRVDFRELLKELASSLKTRIELRQIGNRDEVKNIGGLGPCGRECCCIKFGGEPEHVSVKMAKLQGLSLSPTKINGLCGRLMCCLAYENQTYSDILDKMPKLGSEIVTPDGKGIVQYNDILKEKVTVKIFGKDDSFQVNTYDLSALGGDKNKEEKTKTEEPKIQSEDIDKKGE